MIDDLEEARDWWKEDAKASALPLLEINGDLYIKEGTVIGKTLEDPEDMDDIEIKTIYDAEGNEINSCAGNGNYIRLILRNLEDSLVEDVESYLPIEDVTHNESIGNIEMFMTWQALEPEGFHYNIDGIGNTITQSGHDCRRDNGSDPSGHDWAVCNGGANDDNLCPGIWLGSSSSGLEIFKNVVGVSGVTKYSTWCTGDQLLDIYNQELELEKEKIKNHISIDLEDNQIYALIDVMYAGEGYFTKGTLVDTINSGGTPTMDEFVATIEGTPYWSQNANGSKRRRMADYYIYTQGIYPVGIYQTGDEFTEQYDFLSETPFQDLMQDIKPVEKVAFSGK